MALDTLLIPVMSTECERLFSSTKKLINPMRSLLKTDINETSECLEAWWDCEMITQWGQRILASMGSSVLLI
jgi:hAT family C-terminal dimerisation region